MTDSHKQVMLINMGGSGNIGDRAMALNVIRQIREAAPEASILVGPHTLDFMINEFGLSRYPYLSNCLGRWGGFQSRFPKLSRLLFPLKYVFYVMDTFLIFGLVLLNRYLKIDFGGRFMEAELARSISNSSVIYFCGGGYITDVGRFDSRTNLIMAGFGILARKPVIMSGQGIGPFDSWFSRLLLKWVVPRLDMITFRDASGSEKLLRGLGIDWKNGRSVGDDAMSLPEITVKKSEENWGGVKFGVNLRISPFTPNLDERVEEFTKFLAIISNQMGWQVNFFIFETWRPWEEGVVQSVIEKGNLRHYTIHITEDPREALYLTKQCDLGIGISYHFIVFALKLGIPVLALYTGDWYKGKMNGLLEWYDKNDWVIPVDEISAEKLAERCQAIYLQREVHRKFLVSKTNELAINCSDTIKRAVNYLDY